MFVGNQYQTNALNISKAENIPVLQSNKRSNGLFHAHVLTIMESSSKHRHWFYKWKADEPLNIEKELLFYFHVCCSRVEWIRTCWSIYFYDAIKYKTFQNVNFKTPREREREREREG